MITQKSKEGMLKYLVGDYGEQPVIDNTPEITSLSNFDKNITSILKDEIDTLTFSYKTLYYSDYIIIYGYTTVAIAGSPLTGYILLLDKHFNVLEKWTQNPNGGYLYPIASMNIDETGQFYAVSIDTAPSAKETKNNDERLILFNNFTLNTGMGYQLRVRKTYLLNSQGYEPLRNACGILKSEKEATYYIMRKKLNASSPIITRAKINVGSENEWTNFNVDFISENTIAKIIPEGNLENYYLMTFANPNVFQYKISEDTVTQDKKINIGSNLTPASFYQLGIIKNANLAYTSFYTISDHPTVHIYEITDSAKEIFYDSMQPIGDTQEASLGVFEKNELIFLKYTQKYLFNDNSPSQYANKIGLLFPNEIVWSEKNTDSGFSSVITPLIIANEYNLYKVYSQYGNAQHGTYRYQIVYNSTNYNGEPYDYYEINKPTQLILKSEESNPELLYARNLYNVVTQNNTVTSTAQIPYKLLNGTQIGYQGLIGATNVIMNNEYQTIEKNIFEQLNINIANTWTIINENDPTNHIINQEASNQLVANASQGNYKEAEHIGYYDIIYTDGTQSVKNSIGSKIKLSNTRYKLTFSITVDKEIDRIEITNQYEDTDKLVYVSIDGSSFEIGKSYQISQRVRVDETADRNVVYNNQNVLYNGNQVIY